MQYIKYEIVDYNAQKSTYTVDYYIKSINFDRISVLKVEKYFRN